MENHARYGELIYTHHPQTVSVNLFLASKLKWPERGFALRQETRFPDEAATALVIRSAPAEEMTLRIRDPFWLAGASGVRALKFRPGARVSRNADAPPGRSEALTPLVRTAFGDAMTFHADANSLYAVREAIRIGRLLEAHRYEMSEEPCPFDWLWETKEVADALEFSVAGGEQGFSLRRWQWTIENRGVDIAQPDLHYGGGLIRATQVACMAELAGLSVVPHMSGGGLGYLEVVRFASFTPNIGRFMEFKGNPRGMLPGCTKGPTRTRNDTDSAPAPLDHCRDTGVELLRPAAVRRTRAVLPAAMVGNDGLPAQTRISCRDSEGQEEGGLESTAEDNSWLDSSNSGDRVRNSRRNSTNSRRMAVSQSGSAEPT